MISRNSFHDVNGTKKIASRRLIALNSEGSFFGSPANQAIVLSTAIFLTAGRIGLAPSSNRPATAGLKLQVRESGLKTGDPARFTIVDTLAFGAMGHIVGVGIYFGTVGANVPQ